MNYQQLTLSGCCLKGHKRSRREGECFTTFTYITHTNEVAKTQQMWIYSQKFICCTPIFEDFSVRLNTSWVKLSSVVNALIQSLLYVRVNYMKDIECGLFQGRENIVSWLITLKPWRTELNHIKRVQSLFQQCSFGLEQVVELYSYLK